VEVDFGEASSSEEESSAEESEKEDEEKGEKTEKEKEGKYAALTVANCVCQTVAKSYNVDLQQNILYLY